MSNRKFSNEEKEKATKLVVDKILFRVNALFGPHTNRKKFETKIEMMYKDILPEFDSLSWIDVEVFGNLSLHCMEIIFEDYRNDLRSQWSTVNDSNGVVEYHKRIDNLILKIGLEYKNANVEMMHKFMGVFAGYHFEAFKTVNEENRKGFCYIATMVYGDYSHPNVLVLRNFRDRILKKNRLGRLFIKYYYLHAPKICDIMKEKKILNSFLRRLLNGVVKILNRID